MFKLGRMTKGVVFVGLAAFAVFLAGANPQVGYARPLLVAAAPNLGAAGSFSVLAALSMAANGGGTAVSGNLGLSPGLAVSRTGSWAVGGTEYFGTGGVSQNAQTAALSAYNNLVGQTSNGVWAASVWSPTPGVYTAAGDTTFAGTINLNGSATDVWVFQVGRDMTFSGSVVLAGTAQACNVFWQIGRDASFPGTGPNPFVGTLIASRDITFASGATVNGRIISLNSSLVLNGTPSTITGPTCAAAPVATQTAVAGATQTATAIAATQTAIAARTPTPVSSAPREVPEGDTLLLFGGGIGGLATWLGWQWRKVRTRSKQ